MNNNAASADTASTSTFSEKWKGTWMLTVLGAIYLVGELGHYLIGVISRNVAQDLHYGEIGCMAKDDVTNIRFGICEDANTSETYILQLFIFIF